MGRFFLDNVRGLTTLAEHLRLAAKVKGLSVNIPKSNFSGNRATYLRLDAIFNQGKVIVPADPAEEIPKAAFTALVEEKMLSISENKSLQGCVSDDGAKCPFLTSATMDPRGLLPFKQATGIFQDPGLPQKRQQKLRL